MTSADRDRREFAPVMAKFGGSRGCCGSGGASRGRTNKPWAPEMELGGGTGARGL